MPHKPTPQISRRLVARQEALFEDLQPLARQVRALARQRPAGDVPDAMRMAAEALLFAVEPFRERPGKATLPQAAPHLEGLSVQLAEALSVLVGFETRHTQWNAVVGETMWMVPGPLITVRRLRPRPGSKAAARAEAMARQDEELRATRMTDIRAKLVRRLDQFHRRDPAPGGVPTPPATSALRTPTQPPPEGGGGAEW